MDRKVLGRGLDALISPTVSPTQGSDSKDKIFSISVDKISPSRYQPRSYFDDASIGGVIKQHRVQRYAIL